MKIYNMVFKNDANQTFEYSVGAESKDEALTKFAKEIHYLKISLEPIEDSVSVIELSLVSEITRTDAPFTPSFASVDDGEDYIDQWEAEAVDKNGRRYVIVWDFTQNKGAECPDEKLDFYDGPICLVSPVSD